MIKWVVAGITIGAGFVFAAGCYVGWKTTLKAIDSVAERNGKKNEE